MTTMSKSIGLPVRAPDAPLQRLPFVPPMPSPSVSEHVLENKGRDPSIASVQDALGTLRVAVEQIREMAQGVHGDETMPEGAKHVRAFDAAVKIVKPALMTADAEVLRLSREVDAIKARIHAPLPVRDSLAGEIRAALSRMAPAENESASRFDQARR